MSTHTMSGRRSQPPTHTMSGRSSPSMIGAQKLSSSPICDWGECALTNPAAARCRRRMQRPAVGLSLLRLLFALWIGKNGRLAAAPIPSLLLLLSGRTVSQRRSSEALVAAGSASIGVHLQEIFIGKLGVVDRLAADKSPPWHMRLGTHAVEERFLAVEGQCPALLVCARGKEVLFRLGDDIGTPSRFG